MCENCIWYQYPLLTDNSLTTKQIPDFVPELRICILGGCDGSKYEARQKGNDNV